MSGPAGAGTAGSTLSIGDAAPDFTLLDIQDREVSLTDYRGKVVLLDFWASWCSPCVAAMPFYESLQAEDHGFDLVILTLNLESPDKARRFVEKQGHTLPTLVDAEKKVMTSYGVQAIPDAILIDPDGNILARFAGGNEDALRGALVDERERQLGRSARRDGNERVRSELLVLAATDQP